MPDAPETTADRHTRQLVELAELGMGVARDLAGRVAAAEAPAEAQGLATAFHHVSRSVRQSMALEARLERERRREALEIERQAAETRRVRVAARRKQVGDAGSRLIWTEAEKDEIGTLLVRLSHWCEVAAADEDAFLDAPVETLIARLRRDLGLPANDAAPAIADGEESDDRRSSA